MGSRAFWFAAVPSYVSILVINILGAVYFPDILAHILPLLFIIIPFVIQRTINLRFSVRDLLIGLVASAIVLLSAVIFRAVSGEAIKPPPALYATVTFLLVALPEEAYFRGMLLDMLGCNMRAVIISSLLFAIAHGHRYFIYGDYLAFFTFFPSLIMGYLYMKTRNILTSTLFHGSSNVALII